MDGMSISVLAQGINAAVSTTRALLSMNVNAEVKAAIAELQTSLISTQSAALESLAERDQMRRRIAELEELISRTENWQAIRAKFMPYETSLALAYRSDELTYPGLYCPKCFENERLSRLQEKRSELGDHSGKCLQCGTSLYFQKGRQPTVNGYW